MAQALTAAKSCMLSQNQTQTHTLTQNAYTHTHTHTHSPNQLGTCLVRNTHVFEHNSPHYILSHAQCFIIGLARTAYT